MDFGDQELLGFVLAHELIHIKRFDAGWKLLLLVAVCLHWFNPLVWALVVLMNRDLETTCDEQVLKSYGPEVRANYALSLIKMAARGVKLAPLSNGFSKNATEERVTSIMRFKKTSVYTLILALIFVAGATLVFAESANPRVLFVRRMVQLNVPRLSFASAETEKRAAQEVDGKGKIVDKPSPEAIFNGEEGKIEVKIFRRSEKDNNLYINLRRQVLNPFPADRI